MPPSKHSFTKYVIVLNERSNKYNYFALCHYCKTKITNMKRLVFSHLKSCQKFKEQYNEDERNKILFPEKCDEEVQIEQETSAFLPYSIFQFLVIIIFFKLNK
jgi:hypothetical protein